MEAHSGLSARIVEDTGFRGIWASGLSISASLGLRDCNEASWTQVLDVVETMRDAAPATPILVDGDTGYGNFNNVRRLVKKLVQREINGVCLEDKIFPKRNSFVAGDQTLADPVEFAGKIQAAKDSQGNSDFSVVARLEGFIAGLEIEDLLSRADQYYEAGADALLVHSKRTDPNEVFDFMQQWDRSCPVVIVPTTYADTPATLFQEANVSMVIWANHIMRASISAMQQVAKKIYKESSVKMIEDEIAPLKEVFRLQQMDELSNAEQKYLPQTPESSKAPHHLKPARVGSKGKEQPLNS